MGSDSPLGSFRDVVRPLWKELSNSFSALGMQRRAEDEEASRHANAMKNNLASVPSTSILERNPQVK